MRNFCLCRGRCSAPAVLALHVRSHYSLMVPFRESIRARREAHNTAFLLQISGGTAFLFHNDKTAFCLNKSGRMSFPAFLLNLSSEDVYALGAGGNLSVRDLLFGSQSLHGLLADKTEMAVMVFVF